ncbi:MAG: hypothetical protein PHV53_02995 [Fermentimonas sp.]|nr:hypothetical protein [Fermentimonas sp.]
METGYKEKMYKGVEQQLKSSLRSYAESTLKKNIQQLAEKGIAAVSETTTYSEPPPIGRKSTSVSEPPPVPKSNSVSRSRSVSETTPVSETPRFSRSTADSETKSVGVNIRTWLYLVVSLIIGFRGYLSNEVIGILFCSFIVLLSVFIRRKKEKPYNWFSKLIILVQMIVVASILYRHVMSQYFTLTSLLYAALLYIDFSLLFKGNKQR